MKETALKIKVCGDPVLRKKAKQVSRITAEHKVILSRMARIMYDTQGIGLAAPQVGLSESLIVVDIGSGLYKVINPKIAKKQGTQAIEEGCLSVPGVCIKVKRAKRVLVEGLDEDGNPVAIKAGDLLACVFQHEIDHLHGKLIIDYASFVDKLKYRKTLKALKERADNEKLPESATKSCKLQL